MLLFRIPYFILENDVLHQRIFLFCFSLYIYFAHSTLVLCSYAGGGKAGRMKKGECKHVRAKGVVRAHICLLYDEKSFLFLPIYNEPECSRTRDATR